MAENDNPASTGDANPTGSNDLPPAQGSDDTSSNNNQSLPDDATRRLQSERDRSRSENEKLQSQLEELSAHVYGQSAEKVLNDFLADNKEKFPDVQIDDLTSAQSADELETVAGRAQGRFDKIRNDALQKVREVPDQSMTEEEKAKALSDLEADVAKDGRSGFQKFLSIKQTRSRK